MTDTLFLIAQSMCEKSSAVNSSEEITEWISARNRATKVQITRTSLEHSDSWFYDASSGTIHNQNNSFFAISGLKKQNADGIVIDECPILLQDEIGYLGILCQKIGGVMHFLMQAKIEPGNINCIQLSPTIQATKSNFTQKHGGGKPAYLDFFLHAAQYEIVVDQIQSEQSSRFYKKRNRNILIRLPDTLSLDVLPSHRWMTLGQIKRLMRIPNLVNMDTRTVISCIPYCNAKLTPSQACILKEQFADTALFVSMFGSYDAESVQKIYTKINDFKMFSESRTSLTSLSSLDSWHFQDYTFTCKHPYPFSVIFCDIEIEGREVRHWTQPLFCAAGIAVFGLLTFNDNGILKFVVRLLPEHGCFDQIELAPTIQYEAHKTPEKDCVTDLFFEMLDKQQGILFDNLLSEEGGRFYQEQNRNVIIQADKSQIGSLPDGYFACDFHTLNCLVQTNNVLNIQLRNLLSVLEES